MTTWGWRGAAAAVGIAVAIGGLGGAAVYAATDTGGDWMTGPPHDRPPNHAAHISGGQDPVVAAVHAEYVVAGAAGGFATMLTQTGRVTAVSPTGLTVRSDDGYTQAYVMPPNAAPPTYATGDAVTVHAKRDGEAAVVQTLRPPR